MSCFCKEQQSSANMLFQIWNLFSVHYNMISNEPVPALYCYAAIKFYLLSKQYLICCYAVSACCPFHHNLESRRADWILHFLFVCLFLFFSPSSPFLSLWSFLFPLLDSLKLVHISQSVLPTSRLTLTGAVSAELSWEISFCILQVVFLLIIPVWCFPLCSI